MNDNKFARTGLSDNSRSDSSDSTFVEGVDYYLEKVFTS